MILFTPGTKPSTKSVMRKQLADVFSEKLLKAADHLKDGVVSAAELSHIKGQV